MGRLETRAHPGGGRTTRCSALLNLSGIAKAWMMNGFLPKTPFRPESHRQWRSTPSNCPTCPPQVRPPPRLSRALISNALKCTGVSSRHLGRLHAKSQSLNHQHAHGARTRGPAEQEARRGRDWGMSLDQVPSSLGATLLFSSSPAPFALPSSRSGEVPGALGSLWRRHMPE